MEIKGSILEMIATINDTDSLQELKEMIRNFVGNRNEDSDYWNELNDFEKTELEKAIEESEDDSNLVDHDEVMSKYKKWLDK